MNRCDKCKVNIIGSNNYCPLCKNSIEVKNNKIIFPVIPTIYEKNKTLITWMLLITSVTILIASIMNSFLYENVLWSPFVILGMITFWVLTILTINNKNNLIKFIFYDTLILTILSLIWDYMTGMHGWSINYVIPIMYGLELLMTLFIAKIRDLEASDFLAYLIVEIILGFIPLILMVVGLLSSFLPSVICILITHTILVVVIIFEGRRLIEELKKRLHI